MKKINKTDNKVCQCDNCQNACEYNPGWFLPGQAEKVAKYLKLTLKEFFDKYLGVNWWEAGTGKFGDKNIFLLAPAITKMCSGGIEYPGDPRGTCIFFKDGKCDIHTVKPYECKEYIHSDSEKKVYERHEFVVSKWNKSKYQKQIIKLLGKNPCTKKFSLLDLWGLDNRIF